jgi:hypothetical protein
VGTLRPFQPFEWLRAAVDDQLDPGESVEEMCEFSHWEEDGEDGRVDRLLVLTNRNLRMMTFRVKHRWGRNERGPCTFSATVPLHEIQGITVDRFRSGVLRQEETGFELTWTGGVEVWASRYEEGARLVGLLQEHLARKTASTMGSGMSHEIARLAALADEGVISQEEFTRGKELFLGKTRDARENALTLLRQLHALYKSGVLSESEFNMKKWDVMSRR